MSNSKPNTQVAKKEKVVAIPETLAGRYSHAWETLFNKLTKEEKEKLLLRLAHPDEKIRGEVVTYSNVRSFVKAVAALGEELYEKKLAREAKKSGVSPQ